MNDAPREAQVGRNAMSRGTEAQVEAHRMGTEQVEAHSGANRGAIRGPKLVCNPRGQKRLDQF